jgi:hypothetical protein
VLLNLELNLEMKNERLREILRFVLFIPELGLKPKNVEIRKMMTE